MKSLLSYFIILTFLLALSSKAHGQDGTVQLEFSATEVSGKVFLAWTMNFGQTCNGIDITRSTDNLNFSTIGDIQGVCGSPTDTVSYSFIDESPIPNQINYYRLTLGNLGPSQTLSVEIINLEGTGYQVRPNPIIEQGRIYFDNDRSEEHGLTLFSSNGRAIRQLTTRNDFFELNVSDLIQGIYLFRIEREGGIERAIGKIVVAR
jgi:hypothetical protein